MQKIINKFAEWSALGYGLGLAPKAPGTFGSLGGIVCGWVIQAVSLKFAPMGTVTFYSLVSLGLILLILFSWWSIHVTEQNWGTHDDGRIVIDEFAGQAIACAYVPLTWTTVLLSFVLFRVFDIWKPGPIGTADRKAKGALGTLLDDLIAGAVAGILVCLILTFLPGS